MRTPGAMPTRRVVGSVLGAPRYPGERVVYVADATNGIEWLFEHSGDGSAYPWRCIGGSEISLWDTSDRSTTSAADASMGGLTLTTPLAGDYECHFGGSVYITASGFLAQMRLGTGGAQLSDYQRYGADAANDEKPWSRASKILALAAGGVVRLYGRVVGGSGAQTLHVPEHYMHLRPVRCA